MVDDIWLTVNKVAKKLVRGDFKSGRVQDPTAPLSSRHERSVKKYVKEYMDKAVAKKAAKDKERAERAAKKAREQALHGDAATKTDTPNTPTVDVKEQKDESEDEMIPFLDDEEDKLATGSPSSPSNSELKRKRDEGDDHGSPKRTRTDTPPGPPPPPPPPAEDMPVDVEHESAVSTEDPSYSYADANGEEAVGKYRLVPEKTEIRAESAKVGSYPSPMQLQTPPTTTNGSCEHDSSSKEGGQHFEGLSGSKPAEVEAQGGS